MTRKERAKRNRALRRHSKLYEQAQRLRMYTERLFFRGTNIYSAVFYGHKIDRGSPEFIHWCRRTAGLWYRLWQMERTLRIAAGWKLCSAERNYCRYFHDRRCELAERGIDIPKGPFKKARTQRRSAKKEAA